MPTVVTDDLRAKHSELVDHISELKKDAASAWKRFEAARAELAKSEEIVSEDSDLFRSANEASTAFDEVSDNVRKAEAARDRLVDMMTISGDATPLEHAEGTARLEQLAQHAAQTAGLRSSMEVAREVLASDRYSEVAEFVQGSGTVGRQALGAAFDREETMAALTTTGPSSGGAFTQKDRQAYVPLPLQPLTVLDLITLGTTDSNAIDYVRQLSFTNNAAPVAEATDITGSLGQKPQSNFAWEVVTAATKTIAHWSPITRKAFRADHGQVSTIIRSLLDYGLQIVLQQQIVSGNGSGENLRGILNQTGILHVPAGADSAIVKSHKALTKLRLAFMQPSAFGFHPTDWEDIRLMRDASGASANTGGFLFGPPSMAGAQQLWGIPVIVDAAFPLGTPIVGDWKQFAFLLQYGTELFASDSHVDYFTRNILVLLAELTGVEMLQLPQAFCDINLAAA